MATVKVRLQPIHYCWVYLLKQMNMLPMPTWQQIAVTCATAWRRRDLNPGSPGHEAAALPSALSHLTLVVVIVSSIFILHNT